MRIGAFEINEPIPELHEPHAMAILRPWVDVGGVGSLVLSRLEEHLHARPLGQLARPGNFFDFTRYRPNVLIKEGHRQLVMPNTFVSYTQQENGRDFLFLHLLEPHMLGEAYVESVWKVLKHFGVKRYFLLGSMYDIVPHTRPFLVSGSAIGKTTEEEIQRLGIGGSGYQGPTSIVTAVGLRASETSVDTMTALVHLPQYTQAEEDYMGLVRLLEVLNALYDVPVTKADRVKAEKQREHIEDMVARNPQLKEIVAQLETHYDAMAKRREEEHPLTRLSPEVEKFLGEMDRRFREGRGRQAS
ncbi:MAG: PAC2 family protein [Chloroflexi bacterium]|nr:PAC2 family protein [Chloroflexota bacterium]